MLSPREWCAAENGQLSPHEWGVNPMIARTCQACGGCPHASGGEPQQGEPGWSMLALSPREWG